MTELTSEPPSTATGSLRARLSRLMAVVVAVPLLGLGVAAVVINARALRIETEARHLAISDAARESLLSHVHEAEAELLSLGQLLTDPALPMADAVRLAQQQVGRLSGVDAVALYGPSLELRSTLLKPGVEAPEAPNPVKGAGLHDSGSALWLCVPAGPDANPVLYLCGALDLKPLHARAGLLGERLGDPGAVFIVDRQRHVLVHADAALARGRTPREGTGIFSAIEGDGAFSVPLSLATEFDLDGERYVGALASVPRFGWAVVVQEPYARAFWSERWLYGSVALAVLIALVLALGVGLSRGAALTRPLVALTAATRALAERRFEKVDASVTVRDDELGLLGRMFEWMAAQLRAFEQRIREEERRRAALSRYLSPEVVDLVVKNPEALKLGGERREVTVLFADICGFTPLAEQLPPETIVALLNEHFTVATEIIQRHGGVIDKFIGDAVMAVWGLPEPKPDDAERAVRAAEDLRRWLDAGNRRWRAKLGVELKLAIGLHSGPAVAGNLGSEKRMEYTVVGDTVNVAARLESMAAPNQILISEATRARLQMSSSADLRALGEKPIKGRTSLTGVWELS